jgi:hypothetical protein
MPQSFRVVAKYLRALEFSSPEKMREYLKEHPKADPKNHSVKKDEVEQAAEDMKPLARFLMEKTKSWASKTIDALKNAPKKVQNFVTNEVYRKETLEKAKETLKNAPKSLIKNGIDAAKAEVKTHKTSVNAIKDALNGKELSREQQVALIKTGYRIATAVVSVAIAGPLGGAVKFGASVAQSIAIKTSASVFGGELTTLGLLFKKFVKTAKTEKGEETPPNPDELLAKLILEALPKHLNVEDEDLQDALNSSTPSSPSQ